MARMPDTRLLLALALALLLASPSPAHAAKKAKKARFGQISKLNAMAKDFMRAGECADSSSSEACTAARSKIAEEAARLSESAKKESTKESIKYYVKVMNRVNSPDRGVDYLDLEYNRLSAMVKDGKMSPDKLKGFKRRLNIVHAFSSTNPAKKGLKADDPATAEAADGTPKEDL